MIGSLRKHAIRRDSGNVPTDDLRDLRDAPRIKVPVELQEELRAYSRGISQ